MKIKMIFFKGFVIDLMIEEVYYEVCLGVLICYIVSIYVVFCGCGKKDKMFVCKFCLVGVVEVLKVEIWWDGLKVFDKYVDLCLNVYMNK